VEAVILNRLHVLRHYGRSVIVPTYKQEKRAAGAWRTRLLAGTRKLMIRDRGLLKPTEQRRLRLALARSQALDTVYDFRVKLEKLWDDNAQSNDTRLHSFKQWCHEAEASGVASLQEFAAHLRSYSMRPATA
jgi:stearoyl-CoA desaturase (Delta-9 desaturase)